MSKKVNSTTVEVILFKSKKLSNGEHPLMLRVTKDRKRKYSSLGISCSAKLWDEKTNRPTRRHPDKDVLDTLIEKTLQKYRSAKLQARINEQDFTASGLVEMVERPAKSKTVLHFFKEVFKRLELSGQIGNSKAYRGVYNSFYKFSNKKKRDYTFGEFDYSVLIKYEMEMRSRGVTETTISLHFRTLRALYNMAIKEKVADKKDYPFEDFKISKFSLNANRRAISKEEVRRIEALDLEIGSPVYEARQIFLFIYYGYGINYVDIAKLKWKNKTGDRIAYIRSKTGKGIQFALSDPLKDILNYWAPITGMDAENYIFPILDKGKHISPSQINNRDHKKITETNFLFKEIGKMAKISTELTTYVARHTFATVLKFSGVSTTIISEAMGHTTEAITQSYLKSFENSVIDNAVRNSL
jgi:integrase